MMKKFLSNSALTDIRAPQTLAWLNLTNRQWLSVFLLLLGDVTALAAAWQVARELNHFYSPPPPQLVWWIWLGMPSLFWCFAAVTLLFFAYGGLYSPSARSHNYIRLLQLISLVYLTVLVIRPLTPRDRCFFRLGVVVLFLFWDCE